MLIVLKETWVAVCREGVSAVAVAGQWPSCPGSSLCLRCGDKVLWTRAGWPTYVLQVRQNLEKCISSRTQVQGEGFGDQEKNFYRMKEGRVNRGIEELIDEERLNELSIYLSAKWKLKGKII